MKKGLLFLAVIGVLFSVVSVFYYLKIIKTMYLDDLEEPIDSNIDSKLTATIVVSTILMLLFIFYADDFINYIHDFRII